MSLEGNNVNFDESYEYPGNEQSAESSNNLRAAQLLYAQEQQEREREQREREQNRLELALIDAARTGVLSINNMNLTSLPTLPSTLTWLSCSGNKLTSLPTLPSTLTELYCSDNQLTSLPTLPSTLTTLYCSNNKLTSLPTLPSSLTHLYCNNNPLRTLPKLPKSLLYFDFSNNRFIKLFGAIFNLHLTRMSDWKKEFSKVNDELTKAEETRNNSEIDELIKQRRRLINEEKLIQLKFIEDVNKAVAKEALLANIVRARFSTEAIQKNLNRNQVNPNNTLSEEDWDKYYTRRGEVWTEGISTAPGPWPKNMERESWIRWSRYGRGGKTKKRKSKKSKTHKKRT